MADWYRHGLAGALVPVAVKEHFAIRPAGPPDLHNRHPSWLGALGRRGGAARRVVRGLAGSLAVFSLVTVGLAGDWLVLTRHEPPHERRLERPPRLPWRNRAAWLLVALFALMASTYYGINAWLPDSYVERGWGTRAAGGLLAVLNLMAIPASFFIPWISDRVGGRRPWLVAMAATFIVGMMGVALIPAAAYVWVVALGVASGGLFALVLTLPLDLEKETRQVGALVGMMLGLGYTIGAISPFVLGAVRDLTGSFTASLGSGRLLRAPARLGRSVAQAIRTPRGPLGGLAAVDASPA